ncbi:MAG: C-terminal binding protein [Alphaproteobacteria bacterium]|nr:C-terminal binding protein [Alphaproteobacteria bacterium]
MLIVLSHFTHPDDAIERATLDGRAELYVQPAATAAANPVPMAVRARADAIIHFAANTFPDGEPAHYPKVRALLRSGVGFDKLDLKAWGARGVPVFNVPDYGTSEVADHAIALMLSLVRGTATYNDAIRANPAGNWAPRIAPVVRRLRGQVFGVVGLGRIGLAAALRARGFGMEIAFYDPYLPSGMEIAVGAKRQKSLHDLMAMADILSIHAPSSEETRSMIDAAALARAKPGMVLINTARGVIVDLDALHDALKDGRLAAAGLDVLPVEPADARHKLIAAWRGRESWIEGRLALSPHAAFYSPDAVVDMRRSGVTTILACLETGSLQNCVNLHLLKR